MFARVSIGLRPEFSAKAIGTQSSASAKARIAYCSRPGLCDSSQKLLHCLGIFIGTLTAASSTASEQAISGTATVYDAVIPDEIPDNAESIVQ